MQFSAAIVAVYATMVCATNLPSGLRVERQAGTAAGVFAPIHGMHFEGTIAGHPVNMTGTVEEILTHVEATHPDFKREHLKTMTANNTITKRDLAVRDNKGAIYCCPVAGQPFGFCYQGPIVDGIGYLNHFDGWCTAGSGPGNCVRISCSWNAGTFLCNDNTHPISQPCNYISTFARDIIGSCSCTQLFDDNITCGQEFDDGGWNVVVAGSRC